jgi:tetratricopeptide (TPR) repeat protein
MKRRLILAIIASSALCIAACAPKPATQNANNANNANQASNPTAPRMSGNGPVAAHEVPGGRTGSTPAGGGPMVGTPIDTTKLDANIEKAEKAHTAKPNDRTATQSLANAYFARAEALTAAQQYRSALGDYRRTLKLDPANAPAREMHDQIISIFQQMGREPPAEGQEPPPMHK